MSNIKSNIELSIIIANYNNAIYLNDCISSITGQSYSDYEIIIIDDCSTDNSRDILEGLKNKTDRIRIILNEKNLGVSSARNIGINSAVGEYITTLDSDDIYYDNRKLEFEMDLVKAYKNKHNKTICAFSKVVLLDNKLNYIQDQWTDDLIKDGKIFNNIISRTHAIPRDFIISKDAFLSAGGYDHRFTLYEDWDFKIRLAKKYDFIYTGINGTGYRRNSEGLSNVALKKHINALKRIFKKNFHLVETKDIHEVRRNFSNYLKMRKEMIIQQYKNELKRNYKRKSKIKKLALKTKIAYWKCDLVVQAILSIRNKKQ